jgi:branched-chain amino acid transport system ATP-binding protein
MILQIRNISVSYGPLMILTDISFSVIQGSIVSIVGSNGAGKSTLFKTLSGLIQPTCGSILLFDHRIDRMAPHDIVELGLVLVPEGREIFPKMPVYDNLVLGSYLPKAKAKRKGSLNYVYEIFPILASRKKQMAGSLSGGEQQMLAIGQALMALPKVLSLDEPSLGLAPILVEEIFTKLKEINLEGVTIILGEQHAQKSLELASQGYVLENGAIVLEGTGRELLNDEHLKKSYLGI